MVENGKKFYVIISLFLLLGIGYLLLLLFEHPLPYLFQCKFKLLFDIPCPSCGSSRAWIHLLNGDWRSSLKTNPLGLLSFLSISCFAVLLIIDLILSKQILFKIYLKSRLWLHNPLLLSLIFLLLAINWYWNITKGL